MHKGFGNLGSLEENEEFEGVVGRQRRLAENPLQGSLHGGLTGVDSAGLHEVRVRLLGIAQG